MMSRKFVIVTATLGLALAVSACNTVSGAGEDLQSASQEVEKEL